MVYWYGRSCSIVPLQHHPTPSLPPDRKPQSPTRPLDTSLAPYRRLRTPSILSKPSFQPQRPAASTSTSTIMLLPDHTCKHTTRLPVPCSPSVAAGKVVASFPLPPQSPPFIRIMVELATPKATPRPGRLASRNCREVGRDATTPPGISSAQRKAHISRSALSCLPSRWRRGRPLERARRR